MLKKVTIGIAAISTVVGLLAGPANGAPNLIPPLSGTGTQDGVHYVTARCELGPGVSKDIGSTTYPVEDSATAWATNGSVGLGVAITCYVKDSWTGATYGSVGRGLPGPHTQGAGTIDVPSSSHPYVCTSARAAFSDGGSASYDDC